MDRMEGVRRAKSGRWVLVSGVALACAWGAAGCDGSLAPVQLAPQVPPPSFSLCQAAAGTTLSELGIHNAAPSNLLSANGNLYFPVDAPASIQALPMAGGATTVVSTATGSPLWLDGQAIDFAAGNGGDQLWQVPMAGGEAAVVADGKTTGPPSYFMSGAQAFAGANFLWDLRPQNGTPFWSLYQISVRDGAMAKLADLPEPTGPELNWRMLSVTPQGVLMAYANFPQVGAYLVSLQGGGAQSLPAPAPITVEGDEQLLGVSQTAALWDTEIADPATGATATVTLSLTDVSAPGAPALRTFWPDHPGSFVPSPIEAWPGSDEGSWLIGGTERFDDGAFHATLWSVDAAGNGARIGCDPTQGVSGSGIVTAALPTATAVYAVIGSTNNLSSSFDYRIVQLGL
jgi:hypothetical protein